MEKILKEFQKITGFELKPRQTNYLSEKTMRKDYLFEKLSRFYLEKPTKFKELTKKVLPLINKIPFPDESLLALAGYLCYIKEDFKKAQKYFLKCLNLNPRNLDTWLDLAFTLRHLGQIKLANKIIFYFDQIVPFFSLSNHPNITLTKIKKLHLAEFRNEKIKKSVVITGYKCNNRCRFCNQAHRRDMPILPTFEIKKRMIEAHQRGATYLEFIGGEMTIRKDFFELLKFAKKIGFSTIMISTNGRMFSYEEFAKKTLLSGLNSIVFSIHGHESWLHDWLTQVPGSFQQLQQGVKNVKKIAKKFNLNIHLGSNTCIVKQNYKFLPQIGKYILSLGIRSSEFIFVDPNEGGAYENFNLLVPKISEAAPYIHQCLDLGKKAKALHWHIRYVPLCYFQNYLDQISELYEDKIFDTEHVAPDFYNPNPSKARKEIGRIKPNKCQGCILYDKCEGIWKTYFEHFGDKELKPIKI